MERIQCNSIEFNEIALLQLIMLSTTSSLIPMCRIAMSAEKAQEDSVESAEFRIHPIG